MNPKHKRGPLGRPPIKHGMIVSDLQKLILNGKLGPTSRLPTRRELGQRFGVSLVTVQQALDELTRDGFIEARGRSGTFVVPHPPHLSRYAIVFPHTPDSSEWSRYWTALANEAIRIQRSQPRTMNLYYGIDGHVDNEDYQKLLADVRRHRLAGLVFTSPPYLVKHTPLVQEAGIPRVALMEPDPEFHDIPAVHNNNQSFIDKALDYLAEQGRHRVGLILPADVPEPWIKALLSGLASRGMMSRPQWQQGVGRGQSQWARNLVHLLMSGSGEARPDGLIIWDDNLVEHATAGLVDAGVKVPQEVAVVAHCNFPWPTPSVLPVRRLGYDARQVMKACIEIIDGERRQGPVPPLTLMPAVFEEDVAY